MAWHGPWVATWSCAEKETIDPGSLIELGRSVCYVGAEVPDSARSLRSANDRLCNRSYETASSCDLVPRARL